METNYNKLLKLSRIVNGSFGSSGDGLRHVSGMNVTLKTIDSKLLKAMCIMTLTFKTDQMMREGLRRHRDEAVAMISAAIEKAEEDYSNEFDEKITLELMGDSVDDSTEFIHVSQYSPINRVFY